MKLDDKFVLGLFLFLRMLQLSFDRALGGRWDNLTKYLAEQPNFRNVVSMLSVVCKYDVLPNSAPNKPTASSLNVAKSFLGICTLNKDEISFISWWLLKADDLVERAEYEPSVDEITEVRLNLAYAEELVRSRLKYKDHSIEYVEHFNQNDVHKCRSIEEIVGEPWPNP